MFGWLREAVPATIDLGEALEEADKSVDALAASSRRLSTGALDATEWIGPWSDEKLGLQEIAKNYYPAGFHEPGAALSVACNLEVFNTLTPSQQKAFELSAADAHQHAARIYGAHAAFTPCRLRILHENLRAGACV